MFNRFVVVFFFRNKKKFQYLYFIFFLDLTLTFSFSLSRFNNSSTIFTQDFRHDASIHINLIYLNSSTSNLHFDLWLPFNRGILRTHLQEFPYETPLFINLIYRSPETLSVYLFGQLIDSTNTVISIPTIKSSSESLLAFNTFLPFHSISWSYEKQPIFGRLK